jgi:hypothetical protein
MNWRQGGDNESSMHTDGETKGKKIRKQNLKKIM